MSKQDKVNIPTRSANTPKRVELPKVNPDAPVQAIRPGNVNQRPVLAESQQPRTATVTETQTVPVVAQGEGRVKVAFDAAMEAMTKAETPKERVKAYITLVNVVRSILRHTDRNLFRAEWTAFLNGAQAHKETFNELTAFQGMNEWSDSRAVYDFYTSVMTLVFATRDPKTRFKQASIRIDDIVAIVNRLVPNSGQNIIGYYSV